MRARLTHDWAAPPATERWGFQIQAVLSTTGDSVGVWTTPGVPPDSLRIRRPTSGPYVTRVYLEHTSLDLHDGESSPIEWHFSWTAPDNGDTSRVYFFAAGNSADGDQTPSGDHIFTTADSVDGHLPVDAVGPLPAHVPALSFDRPYPNPTAGPTTLRFSLASPGRVELAIFDAMGRRVRTLVNGERAAGSSVARWDGVDETGVRVRPGTYFARLRGANSAALFRRITLMR